MGVLWWGVRWSGDRGGEVEEGEGGGGGRGRSLGEGVGGEGVEVWWCSGVEV